MNNFQQKETELLKKINIVLNEFENFEKAMINSQGDIIIKNKIIKKINGERSILTNVFREIINNDIKKNGLK